MSTFTSHRVLSVCALLVCMNAAIADDVAPRIVELTITPAAAPTPAMKYSFLPSLRDATTGNAKAAYEALLVKQEAWRGEHRALDGKLVDWYAMDLAELPVNEVKQLITTICEPLLADLTMAVRYSYCDWELTFDEGLLQSLPALAQHRSLARMLILRIRIAIHEGRFADAMVDMQTGIALSRDLGQAPILIQQLVAAAILQDMYNQANLMITDVNAPNFYWAWANLPRPLLDIRQAIAGERRWIDTLFEDFTEITKGQFSMHRDPDERAARNAEMTRLLDQRWAKFMAGVPNETKWSAELMLYYAPGREALHKSGYTVEQINQIPPIEVSLWHAHQQYRVLGDEINKGFGLPYWQAHAFHQKGYEIAKAHAEAIGKDDKDPFAFALIAAIGRAHMVIARVDRKAAALQTIEAIRHHLATHEGQPPASLDDMALPAPADPITGKPFGYERMGNSITLIGHALEDMDAHDDVRWILTIKASDHVEP